MNSYNNEFAACEKINRPGMGEFYQGTSIKLSEPTVKQKQARSYVPYKGTKYTTGENKESLKKINETYREMETDEKEYDLYKNEKKNSKRGLKIGDYVKIYYKPKVMYNLMELGLDHVVNKGYSNEIGYIKNIWRQTIESRRKTFLPVSLTHCNFASVVLNNNRIIDIPSMLLINIDSSDPDLDVPNSIKSNKEIIKSQKKIIKSQEKIIKSQEKIIKSQIIT